MALHLLKLCVGVDTVEQLAVWQAQRLEAQRRAGETPQLRHVTRHMPKRADELLDGGSLYWVIKGFVRVRQPIVGLEPVVTDEGTRCAILLAPDLIDTDYQPRRPHQGWRYLDAADAPPDRRAAGGDLAEAPAEMLAQLRELGLL